MGESKTTTTLFVFLLMLVIGMGIEIYTSPAEYNMEWLNADVQYQKDKQIAYEQQDQEGGFWTSLSFGVNTVVDSIVSPIKIAQLFGRALLRAIIPYSLQLSTIESPIEVVIYYIINFFQLGVYLIQGITMWRIFRRD